MDDLTLGQSFLEGQGRILVPDYDSQSSQENNGRPQKKQRNNSGNNKQSKKPSKTSKQSQGTKLQTTQATTPSQTTCTTSSTYTTARWSMSGWNHRSYGCQVAPTGSLLEEVLNEKKMALLKSPEVVEFLQGLQNDVQVLKEEELKSRGDTSTSLADVSAPKPTSKRNQKRKKSSSTRAQVDKTPVPSNENSHNESPSYDLGGQDPELVLFGREQIVKSPAAAEERRAPTQGASQSDIWSKEASAFSTVTSGFPSNSSSTS